MRAAVALLGLLLASCATPALEGGGGATVTRLTPPSAFHGVHGIRFSPTGELYAGSVAGQALYRVDTQTGAAEVVVGPPQGMADDIAFGPGGQMVWTAISDNIVYSRRGSGPVEVLAKDLVSVNSIAFSRDGRRLFAAQVFGGDALWELDPAGVKPRRLIKADIGGFNSFSPGPDGWLYGPVWFKGQVAKINPDTGELAVVAEGFKIPAAAKFDAKDQLYVIDTATGELIRVDIRTGAKTRVAQLSPSLDNLDPGPDGRVYVSNMADNGIQAVDPATGEARQVLKGPLAFPADVAVSVENGREVVHVADVFAYRTVDAATGAVTDVARSHAAGSTLEYPTGVGAGAGRVILASSPTGAVQIYDRRGGAAPKVLHGFAAPSDAIELADGSLMVTELGSGKLIRVVGEQRTTVAEGLAAPVSLAAGPDGSVYVAEVGAGRVSRVELASGTRTTVAEGLQLPKAVAVGPGGELIVLEVGAKQLVGIDRASGAKTVIAGGLPVGQVTRPFPLAGGVAVGPSGTIYVTSDVENAIYMVTRR